MDFVPIEIIIYYICIDLCTYNLLIRVCKLYNVSIKLHINPINKYLSLKKVSDRFCEEIFYTLKNETKKYYIYKCTFSNNIIIKCMYNNNKIHGKYTCYYNNGDKSTECYYKYGVLDGKYKEWIKGRKIKKYLMYKHGFIDYIIN